MCKYIILFPTDAFQQLLDSDSNKLTLIMQTLLIGSSFEDVPASELYLLSASSSGWTLSGADAYFKSNNNNAHTTPYGSIFVTLYGYANINSVSQLLALASSNSRTYTLSYSYNVPFVENLKGGSCILSVTYGGVTVDSVDISDYTYGWLTRTQVFTPAAGSESVSFIWDCSALLAVDEIDLLLDNISIS